MRGWLILEGTKLPDDRRAVVLVASGRSSSEEAVVSAMRTTFPQRLAESSFRIHAVADSAYDDSAPDDPEQQGIGALVGGRHDDPEVIPKEEAIEILVSCKQQRELISKENQQRAFGPRSSPSLAAVLSRAVIRRRQDPGGADQPQLAPAILRGLRL